MNFRYEMVQSDINYINKEHCEAVLAIKWGKFGKFWENLWLRESD